MSAQLAMLSAQQERLADRFKISLWEVAIIAAIILVLSSYILKGKFNTLEAKVDGSDTRMTGLNPHAACGTPAHESRCMQRAACRGVPGAGAPENLSCIILISALYNHFCALAAEVGPQAMTYAPSSPDVSGSCRGSGSLLSAGTRPTAPLRSAIPTRNPTAGWMSGTRRKAAGPPLPLRER
jgi:hypothetical protein